MLAALVSAAQLKVDWYTLATGPVSHRSLPVFSNDAKFGTFSFDLVMEEQRAVTIEFTELAFMFALPYLATLPPGTRYLLRISIPGCDAREIPISGKLQDKREVSLYVIGFDFKHDHRCLKIDYLLAGVPYPLQFTFTTTVRELLCMDVTFDVFSERRTELPLLSGTLPLRKHFTFQETRASEFEAMLDGKARLTGCIRYKNLPRFAQVRGSVARALSCQFLTHNQTIGIWLPIAVGGALQMAAGVHTPNGISGHAYHYDAAATTPTLPYRTKCALI